MNLPKEPVFADRPTTPSEPVEQPEGYETSEDGHPLTLLGGC